MRPKLHSNSVFQDIQLPVTENGISNFLVPFVVNFATIRHRSAKGTRQFFSTVGENSQFEYQLTIFSVDSLKQVSYWLATVTTKQLKTILLMQLIILKNGQKL
jgi:hypothetical protein